MTTTNGQPKIVKLTLKTYYDNAQYCLEIHIHVLTKLMNSGIPLYKVDLEMEYLDEEDILPERFAYDSTGHIWIDEKDVERINALFMDENDSVNPDYPDRIRLLYYLEK